MKAVAETLPVTHDNRVVALRRVAIVPALNEAQTIPGVVEEIRSVDPEFEILVIDDGSTDDTSVAARRAGALVARLPYNVGIGGAVQTGYQYARDHGFQLAVQIDGDGQHDPAELAQLLAPISEDRADMVVGSRFLEGGDYRPSFARKLGIRLLAGVVSLPHGWGHGKPGTRMTVANNSPGANTNVLSPPEFLDEPSGNGALNGIPVTVTATG